MAIIGYVQDVLHNHAPTDDIKAGLAYLSTLTAETFAGLSPGATRRVELKGDALYAMHQVYATKGPDQEKFEAHRRYIDIQYVFEGHETIKIAALRDASPLTDYDAEKDFALFRVGDHSTLALHPGMVAIFFPEDVHAPGLDFRGMGLIRKTVVKVRFNKPLPESSGGA